MRLPGRYLLLAGLALLLAAGAVMGLWYGPGPATTDRTVVVPRGSSLTAAAKELEAAGTIRSAPIFVRLAGILGSDDPIHAGEYEVPAGASASAVLELLQSGRVVQHLLTIPEGTPSIVVHERLMAQPLLTGDIGVPAEGSVLPDTYSFHRGESRQAVLARMQEAMTKALDEAWQARKPTTAVSSKRDALILASVVEKETGVESERRIVAAVFSNRLKTGMRLQADPTVIYPVTKGKPLGRRILRSELQAVNGYNTYTRTGLPEGPIANPGLRSIQAVLDPAKSDALYFVADGKGGHVFARTLPEHEANVRRFYEIRRQRGEM